jgi:hypothetical protein
VEDASSSSSSCFVFDDAETEVRGRVRDGKASLADEDELCFMAWGGVRFSIKAGIPFGPVGRIFGEVTLCWEDDSDGLRLRSFL